MILLAQLFLGGALAAASCGPVAETEAESLLMSPLHMGYTGFGARPDPRNQVHSRRNPTMMLLRVRIA